MERTFQLDRNTTLRLDPIGSSLFSMNEQFAGKYAQDEVRKRLKIGALVNRRIFEKMLNIEWIGKILEFCRIFDC